MVESNMVIMRSQMSGDDASLWNFICNGFCTG